MNRHCERCGSCCVQLTHINISDDDIRKWVKKFRIDILQFCEGWTSEFLTIMFEEEQLIKYLTDSVNDMEMWQDPNTIFSISLCPFLRKKREKNQFECMIQDTKPEICREYLCDPKDMKKIIKKSFEENLKEYKKRRRIDRSFLSKQFFPKSVFPFDKDSEDLVF